MHVDVGLRRIYALSRLAAKNICPYRAEYPRAAGILCELDLWFLLDGPSELRSASNRPHSAGNRLPGSCPTKQFGLERDQQGMLTHLAWA
jgi:hypothetical protein